MYFEYFLPSSQLLSDMESHQDNHDNHVFERSYQASLSISHSFLLSLFPKKVK